ncbi:hypothetical protein BX600DRAFT_440981 [Xylariales sp. PMI_506]|nr:hypothetical protein BX600DRAFT_440981 [Xylariales sp. PMI_506]
MSARHIRRMLVHFPKDWPVPDVSSTPAEVKGVGQGVRYDLFHPVALSAFFSSLTYDMALGKGIRFTARLNHACYTLSGTTDVTQRLHAVEPCSEPPREGVGRAGGFGEYTDIATLLIQSTKAPRDPSSAQTLVMGLESVQIDGQLTSDSKLLKSCYLRTYSITALPS